MDKINIRDLRVGGWVYYDPNVFIEDEYEPPKEIEISQIKSGEDIDLIIEDCYAPIPITKEILEKNGFVKMASGYYRYFLAYDENYYAGFESVSFYPETYGIDATKEEVDGFQSQHKGKCVYLHQLQNILRDLGIDKEIIL